MYAYLQSQNLMHFAIGPNRRYTATELPRTSGREEVMLVEPNAAKHAERSDSWFSHHGRFGRHRIIVVVPTVRQSVSTSIELCIELSLLGPAFLMKPSVTNGQGGQHFLTTIVKKKHNNCQFSRICGKQTTSSNTSRVAGGMGRKAEGSM